MVATTVTGAIEKKPTEDTSTAIENIGPGGVIMEQENFPIGEPLTISFDTMGKPILSFETGKPDVLTFNTGSYTPVFGPEYDSESPDGLGKVRIVIGKPLFNLDEVIARQYITGVTEDDPIDIVFGGVWFKKVNIDGIPVGTDGHALLPGESPIYTEADVSEIPQVLVLV